MLRRQRRLWQGLDSSVRSSSSATTSSIAIAINSPTAPVRVYRHGRGGAAEGMLDELRNLEQRVVRFSIEAAQMTDCRFPDATPHELLHPCRLVLQHLAGGLEEGVDKRRRRLVRLLEPSFGLGQCTSQCRKVVGGHGVRHPTNHRYDGTRCFGQFTVAFHIAHDRAELSERRRRVAVLEETVHCSADSSQCIGPVSYTHLTLPTIYSV